MDQLVNVVPELACMLALTIVYVRHLAKKDEVVERMKDDVVGAIRDNSVRLGENTEVLREVKALLKARNGNQRP